MDYCHIEPIKKSLNREALNRAMVAYLVVRGIGCPHCVVRVHNSLLQLDGVLVCLFEDQTAVVAYDPECVTPPHLIEAVEMAGSDSHHQYQAHLSFNNSLSMMLAPNRM